MPIDVPYPQAPAPVNPLAIVGQMAQLQNLTNQNRLFGQEFEARKAIGENYGKAINPLTGEFDENAFFRSIAQDPRAAFKAGEALQGALERKAASVGIQQKELEVRLKQTERANSVLGSLLADPDMSDIDAGRKKVMKALVDEVAEGRMTSHQAAFEASTIAGFNEPKELTNYLQQNLLQGMDAKTKMDALYGTLQTVNTGGSTQILRASPMTGVAPLAQMKMTMTPGEAANVALSGAEPVTYEGPQGKVVMPKGVAAGTIPMNRLTGMGLGAAPAGGGNPLTGAAAPVPATPSLGGFIPAGSIESKTRAGEVTGAAAAEQGVELGKQADAANQRKADLQNMLGALDKFEPGPTSESMRTLKAAAGRYGLSFGDMADSTAAQEEFNKISKQIAIRQSQALGAGTDSKLEASAGASPGTDYSKLGNQRIIHMLLGNEDAIVAKNKAWQAWLKAGNSPDTYQQFTTDFNDKFDPRLFQMRYMGKDERTSLYNSLSADDRAKLDSSAAYLQQSGLLGARRGQ